MVSLAGMTCSKMRSTESSRTSSTGLRRSAPPPLGKARRPRPCALSRLSTTAITRRPGEATRRDATSATAISRSCTISRPCPPTASPSPAFRPGSREPRPAGPAPSRSSRSRDDDPAPSRSRPVPARTAGPAILSVERKQRKPHDLQSPLASRRRGARARRGPCARRPIKLKIACTATSDCASAMVARDEGIFAKHGLDADVTLIGINTNIPAGDRLGLDPDRRPDRAGVPAGRRRRARSGRGRRRLGDGPDAGNDDRGRRPHRAS